MSNQASDTLYMKRCLELATLGQFYVAPNPMVGAVLVYENTIIGEGFHEKYGQAHAEVNAINNVKPENRQLISKSTLYVNLEPCSHHGKTPPCSDLIVRSQIPRVIIGCVDSYSEVSGKGIEKLRKHGIEVIVGILEKEALQLNKRFFTFHEKKRPYVILKWAQTSDGFIDKIRKNNSVEINWITQPETQQLTHQWRAEEAGILVGHQTVLKDNPSLSVRAVYGPNPIRVVVTSKPEQIPPTANIFNNEVHTIIYNATIDRIEGCTEWKSLDLKLNSTASILKDLYSRNIQSIIVEGGSATLEHFIDVGLWDEARILTGNQFFKEGIKAPLINGRLINQFTFGKDFIQVYQND